MVADRRDSYRLRVSGLKAHLEAESKRLAVPVLDLSGSGGSLLMPPTWVKALHSSPVVLDLGADSLRTLVRPVRFHHERELAHVGVRFDQMDRTALRRLSRFLIDQFWEQSDSISRVLEGVERSMLNFQRDPVRKLILYHTVKRGQALHVHSGNLQLPLALQAQELTVEATRQLISAECSGGNVNQLREGAEYTFTFAGPNTLNYFTGKVWRIEAKRVLITLPADIRQTGFRDSMRFSLQTAGLAAVHFEHPRLPGLPMSKQVIDVSSRGLSFPLVPEEDLLSPGERIQGLVIQLPDGPVCAAGVIRSIFGKQGAQVLCCGMELVSFSTSDEAERWQHFVFAVGHPRTRWGSLASISRAWEALVGSGYVDLLEDERRLELQQRFHESWARHVHEPRVGRFFLLVRQGHPVATAAANLLYPRTWMPHHFGIDKRARRVDRRNLFDYAREIYSATMYMLRHLTPLEYFVFYFDSAKDFHEMAFGQFLRRYPDKEDFLYDGFQLFKCVLDSERSDPVPPVTSYRVVAGSPRIHRSLSRHLRRHLPAIEFDAMAYGEDEIDLEEFSHKCAHQGYERKRRIFFALEQGEPVCALIAETGDEGLNIFSLFNRCWLVYFSLQALRDERPKKLLLLTARQFYREMGKTAFLLFDHNRIEPRQLLQEEGFEFVADGLRWLARRSVVPAYVNYVEELMGMARDIES